MKLKTLLTALVISLFLFMLWHLYAALSARNISREQIATVNKLNCLGAISSDSYHNFEPNKTGPEIEWTLNDGPNNIILSETNSNSFDCNAVSLKDVAGNYYFGDGLAVNCSLSLSVQGEFMFIWRGCLGIYDENKGTASIKDGVLHIEPNKPNIREGVKGTLTDFFPIRWGSRMYLIPIKEIIDFCSEVNQGIEPRRNAHGSYYLRYMDWEKPVKGKPAVPEQWSKYLLRQPVRGKVIQLIGNQEGWINIGSESGVFEGMILTAMEYKNIMFSMVRLEAVEKGRSRVKCEWGNSRLVVGQTVSSRFNE